MRESQFPTHLIITKQLLFTVICIIVTSQLMAQSKSKQQFIPQGCQRISVKYSETTSYSGSAKGGVNVKIWNGQVNGNYSKTVNKNYTVKEIICPKAVPISQHTPAPVPRPTPNSTLRRK